MDGWMDGQKEEEEEVSWARGAPSAMIGHRMF
jgi:hypothetical protein